MARPRKEGLDYFPLDTILDYKWEAIEACHGLEGFAICIKLYQECYKYSSGEVDYSDVIRRITAEKRFGITEETFFEIINTAVNVELFDKNMWNDSKILTSSGIKKRIDMVSTERKNARIRTEKSYSPEELPNKNRITPEEVHKDKDKDKVKEKQIQLPSWRNNFEIYKSELLEELKNALSDENFISELEKRFTDIDVKATIKKSVAQYWSTEDGWNKKIKSKSNEIDWKKTFRNSLRQEWNQVKKQKTYGAISL